MAKAAGLKRWTSFFGAWRSDPGATPPQVVSSKGGYLPTHWYCRSIRRRFGKSDHEKRLEVIRGSHVMLYVGGFRLPDGNAAAQRVLANAKLFSELGFGMIFLNYSKEAVEPRKTTYHGFDCYECPLDEWNLASRMDIDRIKEIVSLHPEIDYIAAYNYPAPSLLKLLAYCRKTGIKCIGDVTEWYRAKDVSFSKRPIKFLDTALRMRLLNKRADGLIVISSFLSDYYDGGNPLLVLPPLVDTSDAKWAQVEMSNDECLYLIYAGKPSKTKERLDLIVSAIDKLPADIRVRLDVVGLTLEEFNSMYGLRFEGSPRVAFHGRVAHGEAIDLVKRADYSVIVRDDNRVTRAGFPTKFVESVTCGTAVICNENSDLTRWVESSGCGRLVGEQTLVSDLESILRGAVPTFDTSLFDYRHFKKQAIRFIKFVDMKKER